MGVLLSTRRSSISAGELRWRGGGRGSTYPGQVNFHYIERKSRRTKASVLAGKRDSVGTQEPLRPNSHRIAGVLPHAEPVGFEPTVPLLEDFTLAG